MTSPVRPALRDLLAHLQGKLVWANQKKLLAVPVDTDLLAEVVRLLHLVVYPKDVP
jgi:hypothetical protein